MWYHSFFFLTHSRIERMSSLFLDLGNYKQSYYIHFQIFVGGAHFQFIGGEPVHWAVGLSDQSGYNFAKIICFPKQLLFSLPDHQWLTAPISLFASTGSVHAGVCYSNERFLNELWIGGTFTLICQLFFLFERMSVQTFCPFLNCAYGLFLLTFKCSLHSLEARQFPDMSSQFPQPQWGGPLL